MLVQGQGGADFQTAGKLLVVGDLKKAPTPRWGQKTFLR
jgi:hypothetical protein